PKADGVDEDTVLMAVLDAGAEEVTDMGEVFVVDSDPSQVVDVRTALQEAGIDYNSAETEWVASTQIDVDLDGLRKTTRLIDALEDSDDVQNVFTSMNVPEDVRKAAEAEEE
ncbi:MAG: YebC/PmpR family DNA-binding transcriptional regulator, partial [Winkia neuii]